MKPATSACPEGSGPAPRVSVVIPAYNRQHFVGLTIESVLAQTLERWELIVYDDGSTDGTLDVATSYMERDPRIRVASGPNGGVASARNRGFSLTDQRADSSCSSIATISGNPTP